MRSVIKIGLLLVITTLAVYLGLGLGVAPGLSLAELPSLTRLAADRLPDKNLLQEKYIYWCGDTHLVYQGELYRQLQGKSLARIKEIFPAAEGWQVYVDEKGCLHLDRRIEGFCSKHTAYRHLGLKGQHLAIYQGPLGYDQKLLQVLEGKEIKSLPARWQERIKQAQNYSQLSEDEKLRLQEELEFPDEMALQAALDNLDEENSDW